MRKKKHYVAKAAEYDHQVPGKTAEVLVTSGQVYSTYTTISGSSTYAATEKAREIATALNALEDKRSKDRRAAARRRKAKE